MQAVLDLEAGEPAKAAAYLAASVGLGLLAAAGGYYFARAVA